LHSAVESVTAVDDYTVEVKMTGPSPLYPNNLTNTFIMDKGWTEKNNAVEVQQAGSTDDNYAVRNTNGTGPYILESRDPDVRSVLKINANHWAEKKPDITEIIYLPIADNATRVAALLSGEVDLVQDVPVQDVERLGQEPDQRPARTRGDASGDRPQRDPEGRDARPVDPDRRCQPAFRQRLDARARGLSGKG